MCRSIYGFSGYWVGWVLYLGGIIVCVGIVGNVGICDYIGILGEVDMCMQVLWVNVYTYMDIVAEVGGEYAGMCTSRALALRHCHPVKSPTGFQCTCASACVCVFLFVFVCLPPCACASASVSVSYLIFVNFGAPPHDSGL